VARGSTDPKSQRKRTNRGFGFGPRTSTATIWPLHAAVKTLEKGNCKKSCSRNLFLTCSTGRKKINVHFIYVTVL
ncbi:unnamed protein product, partial [Tetraodon nigroviridis]